jgi:hypothetical protein
MRINGYCTLPVLVLFGLLTAVQPAQAAAAEPAPASVNSPVTYPQIVRLSYVEGDVRVARGKEAEKQLGKESGEATGWEQAVADLPLQTGYSLVTGTGRAEIEFEDASVVYLADNSVLEFYQISTTGGVPTTEIALLSGTATVNVQTLFPGEGFRLNAPADHILINYPQKAYLRVNSFLDAIAVTPQQKLTFNMPGFVEARPLNVGQTMAFHNSHRVLTPTALDTAAMSEWDKWVAGRVSARDGELAAAMKDAGLTEPIPGLAEMNGQGKFFACEPYGTCWEPTEGWTGHAAEGSQGEAQAAAQNDTQPAAPVERVAPSDDRESPGSSPNAFAAPIPFVQSQKAHAYLASHPGATMWTEDYTMPCVDYPIADLKAIDPVTGKEEVVDSMFDTSMPYPTYAGYPRLGGPYSMRSTYLFAGYGGMFDSPWDWAVCHAGGWIRWHHRYAWVAGTKRHHKPPVRWVKSGRQVGFVPLHPRDVAGKPPLNLKDGVMLPTKKGDAITVKRDNFKEGKPVELLTEAPKQFRTTALGPLKIAETPQAEAYSASRATPAQMGAPVTRSTAITSSISDRGTAKGGSATGIPRSMEAPGTPIIFDHKTQSFMVAQPVMQNGRPSTVEVPLGGRIGSVQASGNGSSMMRTSGPSGVESYNGTQSSNGTQSRPATTAGSATSAASSTRTYTPAQSNSAPATSNTAPARSYTPPSAPAYSPPQPARSYTPPPAPTYTPPSAPAYTPPPAPVYTPPPAPAYNPPPAPAYNPPPAPAYNPPPAPAYNPPPAPSNSGGTMRR